MEELLLKAMKRNDDLSNKLERYYQFLKFENELDMVLKGTYITEMEIENLLQGNY